MAPLNNLSRKNVRFIWSEECQRAFEELIRILVSEPILAFPDFSKEFILHVDASNTNLGYVLSQTFEDGERCIAFGGKTLKNYELKKRVMQSCRRLSISGIIFMGDILPSSQIIRLLNGYIRKNVRPGNWHVGL